MVTNTALVTWLHIWPSGYSTLDLTARTPKRGKVNVCDFRQAAAGRIVEHDGIGFLQLWTLSVDGCDELEMFQQ